MEVRQPFTRRPPPRRNSFIREEKTAPTDFHWHKTFLSAALMVFGIGFGVFVFPFVEKQVNQPVIKINVHGDFLFLDRREVMSQIPVNKGDRLLDVDLSAIQGRLAAMPWIYSVQVSRQWPNSINIRLVEQKPIAYWNQNQLLNPYGNVFDRDGKVMPDLPVLAGIDGSEVNVMQRFLEFSQVLSPLGMKITHLNQDEQLAWEVEMNNGIRLKLGTTQALEKIQRFVFLYETRLKQETRPVAIVDLRYNNGAAVTWVKEDGQSEDGHDTNPGKS